MIRYSRYEGIRAKLIPNLRFVQTTLGNGEVTWVMERMLSQLEYHEGNFKEAIDSAYRALALINREFFFSVQSIYALSILA